MFVQFNLKKANRFLPHILLIGVGIGTANYIMNGNLNWIQWVIQSLSTSLLIGYTLVALATNKYWLESNIRPFLKLYFILFLAFFLIGIIATEVEQFIKTLIFSIEDYQFFSAGKMYLFNGIISVVLGFSFFQTKHFFPNENFNLNQEQSSLPNQNKSEKISDSKTPLIKLPVKQGENILLIPIENIAYLEAFDNYSFVYDLKGGKRLCDYSLLFLQERLGENFIRIHRKFIVNISHVKQIKPHSNSRYRILFDTVGLSPIVSSKSYSAIIRTLIRIK